MIMIVDDQALRRNIWLYSFNQKPSYIGVMPLFSPSEFLQDMRAVKKGHIVNITSVMERDPVKGFAVYTGTKHFWTGTNFILLFY